MIYDDGREQESAPAPGSVAAQFQAVGGWPGEISWIAFVACQDEEDEHPEMDLQFFEAGGVEQSSNLHVDLGGLKALHSSIGAILKDFS